MSRTVIYNPMISCIFTVWRPLVGQVSTNPKGRASSWLSHPTGQHLTHPTSLKSKLPQMDRLVRSEESKAHNPVDCNYPSTAIVCSECCLLVGMNYLAWPERCCNRAESLRSFIQVLGQRVTIQQTLSISSRNLGISENVFHHHQPGSCLRNR